MNAPRETTLAAVAGSTESSRLLLVLLQSPTGSRVELREQSWADGVGWYTQSSVRIETEQVAELRNALGLSGPAARLRGEQPSSASALAAPANDGPQRQSLRIVG